MYRCFIISLTVHGLLVVALVVLMFITPPTPPIKPPGVLTVSLGPVAGGGGGAPTHAAPRATPRPVSTPHPATTPVPQHTPTLVHTAIPKPAKTPPPLVVTPRPTHVIHRTDQVKKVIEKKPEPIIEEDDTPIPKKTPVPEKQIAAVASATPAPEPMKPEPAAAPTATPAPADAGVDTSLLNNPNPNQPDKQTGTAPAAGPVSIAGGGGGGGDANSTYYSQVAFLLRSHFHPPYKRNGAYCRVKFTIMRDGTITEVEKVGTTGNGYLDDYALKALTDTGKLPPLYDDYTGQTMQLTVTFDYAQQ